MSIDENPGDDFAENKQPVRVRSRERVNLPVLGYQQQNTVSKSHKQIKPKLIAQGAQMQQNFMEEQKQPAVEEKKASDLQISHRPNSARIQSLEQMHLAAISAVNNNRMEKGDSNESK